MVAESFTADLTLTYSAGEIPEGISEMGLLIFAYDTTSSSWNALPSDVDTVANTITAQGIDRWTIFMIGSQTVPPQQFVELTGAFSNLIDARGACWGDFNNDAGPDLFVAGYSQSNRLFFNQGDGSLGPGFALPTNPVNTFGVAAGDYDNDGDLDLYLGNYLQPGKLLSNDGTGGFTDVTPGVLAATMRTTSCSWVDYDNDGDLDLFVPEYEGSSRLFRNDGLAGFTDVTSGALAVTRKAYSAAWADFDGDGDRDVFLAAFGEASTLLRNDGNTVFTDITSGPLLIPAESAGAAWGDYDNDGDPDLYVTNFAQSNVLYRNDGGGVLTDVTQSSTGGAGNDNCAQWGDSDNDGDLDLYVVSYGGPNRLLRNDGGGTFSDATQYPLNFTGSGVALTWADFDGNGSLDLFVTNYENDPCMLFRNVMNNGNHWLQVRLKGEYSNRNGVGARIKVVAGGQSQIREIGEGSNVGSIQPLIAAFGLGSSSVADSVVVYWPSGIVQFGVGMAADRAYTIHENSGNVEVGHRGSSVAMAAWHYIGPNPTHDGVRASYSLAKNSSVRVTIHDQLGRLIRVLEKTASKSSGRHDLFWDSKDDRGRTSPAGMYFIKLRAGDVDDIRRVALIR